MSEDVNAPRRWSTTPSGQNDTTESLFTAVMPPSVDSTETVTITVAATRKSHHRALPASVAIPCPAQRCTPRRRAMSTTAPTARATASIGRPASVEKLAASGQHSRPTGNATRW